MSNGAAAVRYTSLGGNRGRFVESPMGEGGGGTATSLRGRPMKAGKRCLHDSREAQ